MESDTTLEVDKSSAVERPGLLHGPGNAYILNFPFRLPPLWISGLEGDV
jgi:hypothetical protein